MQQVYAYVQDDKIIQVVVRRTGGLRPDPRPGVREVDISAQPWLKVGDYWGPDPTRWVKNPQDGAR